MNPTWLLRRRPAARGATLVLAATGALLVPTVATAADTGATTVVATIGPNGAVRSMQQIAANGSSSAFDGTVPVKLSITRSTSGGRQTYSYHVENTFSRQQSVTFTDTKGKQHTVSVTVQLPLVAQLGVTLPASMTDVTATGATITTDATGARRLLWEMVLFSPIGAAANDVTFSARGSGAPTAELRATAVDPATTAGLSGTSQAANAAYQQDDFWNGYASGGNDGLTQLRDGVAQMIAGLEQLHSGLVQGQDGATKLDAGTAKAYAGSKTLSSGLGQISTGAGALSTGIGKIHAGQSDLTTGLGQISGGLGQLADPTTGLPAAVAGLDQINTGIGALLAGVGDDATVNTLINGIDQISGGLQLTIDGINSQLVPALQCVIDVQSKMVSGATLAEVQADPCMALAGITTALTANAAGAPLLAVAQGVLGTAIAGIDDPDPNTGLVAGLTALKQGADLVRAGLSHPVGAGGATDQGGVREGLLAISAGLAQLLDPTAGLPAAVAGVDALNTGAAAALTGSQQLVAGSAQALTGSKKLAAGSTKAFDGSKDLVGGLGQLSAGQHQVATGLPAAVDGVQQLLDGAKQVHEGVGQVQDGAVKPLTTQLTQASQNAHQQIAVLGAAAALAGQAPGGPGTAYVLSQDPQGFRLAAATSSTGTDHTARNVGLGLGTLALLVIAVVGGFAAGRRSHLAVQR